MSRKYKIFAATVLLYIAVIPLIATFGDLAINNFLEDIGVLKVGSTGCTTGMPSSCFTSMTAALVVFPHLLMLIALFGLSTLLDFMITSIMERVSWRPEYVIFIVVGFTYLLSSLAMQNFLFHISDALFTGFSRNTIPFYHAFMVLALLGVIEILTLVYRALDTYFMRD
jgi:hypothetical protein